MKQKYLNNFINLVRQTDDKALLTNLFEGIFTPSELEEIPMRLEITKRLVKGQPQQQIAADLGVGIATVTRGSRELHSGHFKVLLKQAGLKNWPSANDAITQRGVT